MKNENKKDYKVFGIILILLGALFVFSAFFTVPLLAAFLNLTGRIIIIISMLILFIGKNEN